METAHLSVVSHGQGELVQRLLNDINSWGDPGFLRVTLTLNFPEELPFDADDFRFKLSIVQNAVRKGFGANHNSAFNGTPTGEPYFAVVNPDVRMPVNIFPPLMTLLRECRRAALVAPAVYNSQGLFELTARRFPTPLAILRRAVRADVRQDYPYTGSPLAVDWIAGMFMLFRTEMFAGLSGFDERYFLYYEDVDIGCRIKKQGLDTIFDPSVSIIHDARRQSHRSIQYLKWHLVGMSRFWLENLRNGCARNGIGVQP